MTAAIVLLNCRYLDWALANLRGSGMIADEAHVAKLPTLGWDHINLAGCYAWSDALSLDVDGFIPLKLPTT